MTIVIFEIARAIPIPPYVDDGLSPTILNEASLGREAHPPFVETSKDPFTVIKKGQSLP